MTAVKTSTASQSYGVVKETGSFPANPPIGPIIVVLSSGLVDRNLVPLPSCEWLFFQFFVIIIFCKNWSNTDL